MSEKELSGSVNTMVGGPDPAADRRAQLIAQVAAARAWHSSWRAKFVAAIEAREPAFEPSVVALDDRCELGRWLTTLSLDVVLTPECRQAVQRHGVFHAAAGEAAEHAAAGRYDEALAVLGSRFLESSEELFGALDRWLAALEKGQRTPGGPSTAP